MRFRVWLTTREPFAVSRNRATGNQLDTVRHIPGTTWRGSLASSLIASRGLGDEAHKDADFKLLFLSGRVRYGDLRYGGSAPFPLSARVCSRHSKHRMRDLLFWRQLDERLSLPRTCQAPTVSGLCDSKIVPFDGTARIKDGLVQYHEPGVRLVAHTAITNESLRAREGQFHSSTVVERGEGFVGEAWAQDKSSAASLENACTQLPEIVVGRGSTRGQGLAELRIERLPEDNGQDLKQRLRKLNAPFEKKGKLAFTVTFNSPCLVYDEWNFARPYLTPNDLRAVAGDTSGTFSRYQLADWFSRLITIEGWNTQAGLPKTAVSAIAPGSAYLFIAEVRPDQYEAEIERLAGLLGRCASGIGERWDEGFGEACFCDPVHFEGARA